MDITEEYRQIRENAGAFDASSRSKIEIVGPDSAAFLHNLSTNDIRNLPAGAGCETFLTNAKAKVVAFGCLYHLPSQDQTDTFWLDLDPGAGESSIQHLNKFLISEQVEIIDRTSEFSQLYLLGPKARDIIAKSLGTEVGNLSEWECKLFSGPESLPCQVRFHHRLVVNCFEVIFPAAGKDMIWNLLTKLGAMPVGPETFEIIRVEAGIPVYEIDIDENVLAPEVGRSAISYSKGCYLGQETIIRIRDLGHVNRMLRGLKILPERAGSVSDRREAKIFHDGKEVGQVTSSVKSPRLGIIALAYLHRSCIDPGTRVQVAVAADRFDAEVSSLPFDKSPNH
jgi:folate-binding protein YgfZ